MSETMGAREDSEVAGSEQGARGRGRARKFSASERLEFFLIPIIVVLGFLGYVWWHQTASMDSVEQSSLAWPAIRQQAWQHVELTVVSAFLVVVIAVPLGIVLTRPGLRAASGPVVAFANGGQAAPSVGLIVLLFMWFTTLAANNFLGLGGFFGSGFWTAVVALTVYGLLPVLRNTITGLQGVDQTLVEAGRGMGMSNFAVLRRIELPLALPVIMAGIRTALVLLVGTASLAAFINGGGLGGVLSAGISLYRFPVIVSGGLLIALLALLIEWLGRVLELLTRPKGV